MRHDPSSQRPHPIRVREDEGVSEAYIVPMGEHLLLGLGMAFDELVQRSLTLLDYSVKILCGSHLESSFLSISCDHLTLFFDLPRAEFMAKFAMAEFSEGQLPVSRFLRTSP
jgi:hypothetical protein